MGQAKYFTQDNIDDYLDQLRQVDEKKPDVKKYSESTQKQLKAALAFYLCDCLGLGVNTRSFKVKSDKKRERQHEAYTRDKWQRVLNIAQRHSRKALAMVRLLWEGACRIQDIVGPTFSDVKKIKPNS